MLARRILLVSAVLFGAPVGAQDKSAETVPAIFQTVVDCRAIADQSARLACFDTAVAALARAQEEKQLVIADREQIREARRGLFGLSLPDLKLFSSDGDEGISEITSTLRSARPGDSGKWILTLEDGARWAQTDSRSIGARAGDPVRIRRGAMGSFFANVDDAPAIRVKRLAD